MYSQIKEPLIKDAANCCKARLRPQMKLQIHIIDAYKTLECSADLK